MDLLGSIMDSMGEVPENQKKKKKKPTESETQSKRIKTDTDQPGSSTAPGAPSFRIPKKSSGPSTSGAPSGSFAHLSIKQEDVKPPQFGIQQQRESAPADELKPTSSLEVELNALTLKTDRCKAVQKYHLDICIVIREGKEKDATHCQKNDIAKQRREFALFAIVRKFIDERKEHFGNNTYAHCYDGGYILYSSECTLRGEELLKAEYEIAKLNDKRIEDGFPRGRITIEMKHTGEVYLDPAHPLFHEGDNIAEALKVLNCLSSQTLHEGHHLNYVSKSFDAKKEEKELGQGKILKCGLDKNVRLMGDTLQNSCLIVQGSAKISAFYKAMPLLRFLGDFLQIRGGDEQVARCLQQNQDMLKKAGRELKNVVVSTTHLAKNKPVVIRALIMGSANSELFEFDGQAMTVAEYFKIQKKIRLRYPDAPLAAEINGNRKFLYPLELLVVENGQRVSNDKLAGELTSSMLKEARMLPHEQKQRMIKLLNNAKLKDSTNPYLEAFGITNENQFVQAVAAVIAAPNIKAGNNVCAPRNDGQMGRFQFSNYHRGAIVKNPIRFVVFDRCMEEKTAQEFVNIFSAAAKKKGMRLNGFVSTEMSSELIDDIEQFFIKAVNEKAEMILCVTARKLDKVHDVMKRFEAKHRIVTQHLALDTAKKIMEGRGGGATVDNVLMKFNEKLLGLNTIIEVPNIAVVRGGNARTINDKIFAGRMFFGIEMSHAAAQSLFDRQNQVRVSEPTVVGMAYTVKENTNMTGRFWFQQPRLHKIQYMEQRFLEALKTFYENNQKLPRELVIYRGGGSEGEFADIREEIKQVHAACKSKEIESLSRGRYSPPILLIVAMKNSNNMLFKTNLPVPQRGPQPRAGELNVPSGTCIEGKIMNPMYEEFCLQSQEPRIGTSKPMRYVILVNEGKATKQQVIHFTHWLSFGHQVSTGPTHKPNVLFGAENLAKRGRANWQTWKNENADATSSGSGPELRMEPGEEEPGYFERISKVLNNGLKGMYWA